jgi:hypothetical protein
MEILLPVFTFLGLFLVELQVQLGLDIEGVDFVLEGKRVSGDVLVLLRGGDVLLRQAWLRVPCAFFLPLVLRVIKAMWENFSFLPLPSSCDLLLPFSFALLFGALKIRDIREIGTKHLLFGELLGRCRGLWWLRVY